MESLKAPARRRLGAIARGLRTGHAATFTTEEHPALIPEPPPMPEQGSVAAEGLELLRDADVQRFLVDGFLLIQPSSLSSAFHADLFQQLEDANEQGNNRELQ